MKGLTLFDLDHTLLDGDSDVLWCDFLVARGLLDAGLAERSAAIEAAYSAGSVDAGTYCGFYVGLLAGRTPAEWEPLRSEFLATAITPRIKPAARALVQRHRDAGDTVVLTTATNRCITELTARHLGIGHLIATEPALGADGRYDGCIDGVPNMRAGKVERLKTWLAGRGMTLQASVSSAYSDSINDLPLLEAVDHPVAVDPDDRLRAVAAARGWPVVSLLQMELR